MAAIVDLSQLLRCGSKGSATARTSALVVLDCGCNIATLRLLWERCGAYRVVADGAANGLLDDARAAGPLLIPDAIAGDCDSIRPEVAAHFQTAHGVPLLVDEDQDCHDMVKCVRAAQAAWRRSGGAEEHADPPSLAAAPGSHAALASGRTSADLVGSSASHTAWVLSSTADTAVSEASAPPAAAAARPVAAAATLPATAAPPAATSTSVKDPRWSLFVYGAFGGRFDHEMANLNALFTHAEDWARCFSQVVLLGEDCAACLLPAGRTRITVTAPGEGPKCGLLPIGGPVESVRTRGLHWDLAGQRCAFGSLVSTSNWVESVYPFAHVCNVDTSAGGGGGAGAASVAGASAGVVGAVHIERATAVGIDGDTGAPEAGASVGVGCDHGAAVGSDASCKARPPSVDQSGRTADSGATAFVFAEPPGGAGGCCCSVHASAVEVEASQPIVWTIQLDWRHALSGRWSGSRGPELGTSP